MTNRMEEKPEMTNAVLSNPAEAVLDPLGRPATLWGMLKAASDSHPGRDALVMGDLRISYGDLVLRVERTANELAARGLTRGDRLALWLPNSVDWAVYALAANRLGATIFPVNTRYKIREARTILRHSEAKGIVYSPSYWNQDYAAMVAEIAPQLSGARAGADANSDTAGSLTFEVVVDASLQRAGSVPAPTRGIDLPEPAESDEALLMYTSGTTGTPKGVVHTNILVRNVRNIAAALHAGDNDRFLGHLPLYHIAGFCTAFAASLAVSGTYYVMPEWDAEAASRLIQDERITILGGIPTHYVDLVEAVRKTGADTSSLKSGWIGGANVSAEIVERALTTLQMDALQAVYGTTETTSSTTLTPFEESREKSPMNTGVPIGDFEVGIFDAATDQPLPNGKSGEIRVRGHIVMKGYLKNPQATRDALTPGGWYRTGDVGAFANGYLSVLGRVKDIYITGGSNVYPAEVEAIINELEGVRQAAVIGIPDGRLGEVGKAFVQLEDGAEITPEEIRSHCKTHLAGYKVPHIVDVISEFPMTASGKIQRSALS